MNIVTVFDSPLFISLADEGIAHVPLYSIPFDLVAMMLILPAKLLAQVSIFDVG